MLDKYETVLQSVIHQKEIACHRRVQK